MTIEQLNQYLLNNANKIVGGTGNPGTGNPPPPEQV